jgi:hypothetical protein
MMALDAPAAMALYGLAVFKAVFASRILTILVSHCTSSV